LADTSYPIRGRRAHKMGYCPIVFYEASSQAAVGPVLFDLVKIFLHY
jgi:hypothetical protein